MPRAQSMPLEEKNPWEITTYFFSDAVFLLECFACTVDDFAITM